METVIGSNCGKFHLISTLFTKWTLHSCIASVKPGSFMQTIQNRQFEPGVSYHYIHFLKNCLYMCYLHSRYSHF